LHSVRDRRSDRLRALDAITNLGTISMHLVR
jgi:hypothetical protein